MVVADDPPSWETFGQNSRALASRINEMPCIVQVEDAIPYWFMMTPYITYTPNISEHDIGKSAFLIGDTSSNGCFPLFC